MTSLRQISDALYGLEHVLLLHHPFVDPRVLIAQYNIKPPVMVLLPLRPLRPLRPLPHLLPDQHYSGLSQLIEYLYLYQLLLRRLVQGIR